MSDSIPIEIQMEIVKRVPVKSLFRFRSVSKSWKSVIDSSQFIADYNACESRPQRLLIGYEDHLHPDYGSEFNLEYVIIVDDDIFPQQKFATTCPMSLEHIEILHLVGSSHGLYCLMGECRDGDSAFIWNPAIRKSIVIDLPVLYEFYYAVLGFGVCPKTNDLKLVKINNDIEPLNVEVFTLSSRVWRSLPCNEPGNQPWKSYGCKMPQIAIDGFIYWHTLRGVIVSFDITSEEFTEINLPKSFGTKGLTISNLRESLAVIEYYRVDEKQVFDVWMMDHGVPKSFTKLFTFTTPNVPLRRVWEFRKNGEVILGTRTYDIEEPAVLKVYEPRSQLIKDIGTYGHFTSFTLRSYKETLFLLDQPDYQHIKI